MLPTLQRYRDARVEGFPHMRRGEVAIAKNSIEHGPPIVLWLSGSGQRAAFFQTDHV
jgi:hypothetical protein